jgi:hypothetical protein
MNYLVIMVAILFVHYTNIDCGSGVRMALIWLSIEASLIFN